MRWILVLCLAGALPGCGPVASADAPHSVALGGSPDEVVWWHHVTELGSSLAWFGPTVRDAEGREQRYWVMSCTMIGASEPCMWFQSTVDLDSDTPVAQEGTDYSVTLRPDQGRTWGEVHTVDHLIADVRGFAP